MTEDPGPLFRWRPAAAEVKPFPSAHRAGFIRKNAAHVARWRRPEAIEDYLDGLVRSTRERLVRAGVPEDVATADATALQSALWAEYRRLTASRGGRGGAA